MILQEVSRLYPALPILHRYATETVEIGNLTIPAGVQVSLHLGLLQRDPDIWGDDANEFNPLEVLRRSFQRGKDSVLLRVFRFGPTGLHRAELCNDGSKNECSNDSTELLI